METNLRKIHSRDYVDYVVERNGEMIYDIHLPERPLKLRLRDESFLIGKDDAVLYEMKMNPQNFNYDWSSEVFNNEGEQISHSYRRDRKVNFFIGHTFYEFEFMGRRFETLVMSVKGIKLLIFDIGTGEQVGLAESSGVLRSNLNNWTLYAQNEQDSLITLFATLEIDYRRFMLRGRPRNNVEKIFIGAPKKLKEKYQPSFKDGLV